MIKFIDLYAQYLEIKDEIDSALRSCISESSFIKGRSVTEFEDDFAGYLGTGNCIGCGNGTDALEMILAALGIGKGDEVIAPALSWIATAEAVNNAGAEPVFVDINPVTYTIDTDKIEEKINSRTKAIIPVHLYGCPCEMDAIDRIAKKYRLHTIEDCAQAHGAEYKGRKAGTFGIASAFSFFPSKNLGAFGDAGAVVTDNPEIAEKVRRISNHGQLHVKHSHAVIGRNSRLDTLQAAVLKVKLKYLDVWNERRIEIAHYYRDLLLKRNDIILPEYGNHLKHVFHLFVIRTGKRKEITDIFNDNGISWGIHYPNPIPFLDAYKYKNHVPADFPVSHSITKEILSLLIHPHLNKTTAEFICSKILV